MESPGPDSPSPSTPSSGSPPPEEIGNFQPSNSGGGSFINNLTSHLTSTFSGSSSKRRLPAGSSFAAASSNRDPKTRRRGDSGRMDSGNWEGKLAPTGRREKDELVDPGLVEFLRKEIGDPFQERRS